MTSLIIFVLAVAAVAAVTFFLTNMSGRFVIIAYTFVAIVMLLLDYSVITPTYNIITTNLDIEANVQFHSKWNKSIMSYVNSERFDEFPNTRKITRKHIETVLKELRSTDKAQSVEEYSKLNCYLHETMNKYTRHGRATIRCFGKPDNHIKMWVSLLITGESQFKQKPKFTVFLKKSILENAYEDISGRWEKFLKQVEAEQKEAQWKANYSDTCYWTNIKTTQSSPKGLDSWCKYLAKKKWKERNED